MTGTPLHGGGRDGGHLARRDCNPDTSNTPEPRDLPITISASRNHLPPSSNCSPAFVNSSFSKSDHWCKKHPRLTVKMHNGHVNFHAQFCVLSSYWDITPLQLVLVSAVRQRGSAIGTRISPPSHPHPSPLGRHRAPSSAPCSHTVLFNPHDALWLPKPSVFDSKASPALPAGPMHTPPRLHFAEFTLPQLPSDHPSSLTQVTSQARKDTQLPPSRQVGRHCFLNAAPPSLLLCAACMPTSGDLPR